jgi:hypothetical protein
MGPTNKLWVFWIAVAWVVEACKTEAIRSSETPATTYKTAWRRNPVSRRL